MLRQCKHCQHYCTTPLCINSTADGCSAYELNEDIRATLYCFILAAIVSAVMVARLIA